MKITLETLFRYRQYTDRPQGYCCDRYTGRICRITDFCKEDKRFLPLPRIDERRIESGFLALHKEGPPEQRTDCFGEQMQRRGLWEAWWAYYKAAIYEAAREWCAANGMPYRER